MSSKHATRRIFRKSVWQMTPNGQVLIPEECDSYLYKGPVAEAVAFLYTPPFGVPGDLSRPGAPNDVETGAFVTATPFPAFGLPGKISGNGFVPIANTGDVVYGFLVRPYPSQGANASDPLGTAVPMTTGPCSIMRSGYMNVYAQLGTPAYGAAVYVRYQNPSGSQIVGGLEQGSTGNNYLLSGAQWMGPPDANGNAEICWSGTNAP